MRAMIPGFPREIPAFPCILGIDERANVCIMKIVIGAPAEKEVIPEVQSDLAVKERRL